MTLPSGPSRPTVQSNVLRGSHHWAVKRLLQYLRSPRFWLGLVAGIVVATVAGPFNTLTTMTAYQRFAYWTLILLPSVALQFYLSMTLREFARRTNRPWGLAALGAAVPGAVVIIGWELVIERFIVRQARTFDLGEVVLYVSTIVIVLTMLFNAFMPTLQPLWGFRRRPIRTTPAALGSAETDVSPFFDRLPADLGREVICIRADNHHLEVTTTRGHARVLIRLADAEADLAALTGMRVHRSWWVNLSHVRATESRDGTFALVLSTGARVPVSRTIRPAVVACLNGDTLG